MKVVRFLFTLLLLLSFTIKAQEIKIGTQTWTSKNLNVSAYRNGDKIPQVQDAKAWVKLKTGAWCYHQNKTANGTKYGKLYNWYAVNDKRCLAPKGYHIPSVAEWDILIEYLGGGFTGGARMKSKNGWKNNGYGNNRSGFAALPGGSRYNDGDFDFVGVFGHWWSSSEFDIDSAWGCTMISDAGDDAPDADTGYFYDKPNGFSVRCVKD